MDHRRRQTASHESQNLDSSEKDGEEERRRHGAIFSPRSSRLGSERFLLPSASAGVPIPKRGQVNKWRLIVDLSAPDGYSVNDGINPQHCTLSYISVDVIAQTVLSLGRGCLLAKTDVKSAYRQVPVHPQDRCLLGMRWLGRYFVDATLPFGLRSAPLIFSAVADALEWVVRQAGVRHIYHYIDDFVLLGPPRHNECADALLTLRQVCDNLGVRIAEEKNRGSSNYAGCLGH